MSQQPYPDRPARKSEARHSHCFAHTCTPQSANNPSRKRPRRVRHLNSSPWLTTRTQKKAGEMQNISIFKERTAWPRTPKTKWNATDLLKCYH